MSTTTNSNANRAAELKENYDSVTATIPENVRLVVVSKYKPASDIQALYDIGHRHFGENYVQELVSKANELPKDINWHFIGACQSNKCKQLAQISNLWGVETVDSESKANKLNNGRDDDNSDNKLNVYVQVNTSGEEQKSGLSDMTEIKKLVEHIKSSCPKLNIKGVMTIGSFEQSTTSNTNENVDFTKLKQIRDQVAKEAQVDDLEMSMGMSNDYLQAIKQGSDNVRVGSAIFGARKTKEEMKAL